MKAIDYIEVVVLFKQTKLDWEKIPAASKPIRDCYALSVPPKFMLEVLIRSVMMFGSKLGLD